MMYYFPCRPYLLSIDHPKIAELDVDNNWWAEIKKNGSRTVFWKTKDVASKKFGDFVFYNRYKEIMSYIPPVSMLDELRSLELPNNTHLDLELIDKKTKTVKNQLYIYDVYIFGGKIVTDPLQDRHARLEEIFKDKHYEHLSVAQIYQTGFKALYYEVTKNPTLNEGLVLKDRRGKIVWNAKASPNVSWQIKCRVQSSNYRF